MPEVTTRPKNIPFPKSIMVAVGIGVLIAIIIVVVGAFTGSSNTLPSLDFHPKPNNSDDRLIAINILQDRDGYKDWDRSANAFVEKYYTPGLIVNGRNAIRMCSYDNYPQNGEICDVDMRAFDVCSRENYFGYHRRQPCVFLTMETEKYWIPEYYNDTANLPAEMPLQLKEYINGLSIPERNTVWVTCEGETKADIEYIGPIKYFPTHIQGFPGYFYPDNKTEGYLSPLVAVQFSRPSAGIVLGVHCRAWAKNIIYNDEEKTGSVHFELLID